MQLCLRFQTEFGHQLKNCDAIIVMYSLTDRVSFHVAREILDDLANLANVVCPVLLLANKMDLCHHRKVTAAPVVTTPIHTYLLIIIFLSFVKSRSVLRRGEILLVPLHKTLLHFMKFQ